MARRSRFSARILDDLLRQVFSTLLSSTDRISPTRGDARELIGVLLQLELPRARLSRTETRGKPFSCLGELLWYLSKDNSLDFISHYIGKYEEESEDGQTVYGGYGPRIFAQRGNDQLRNVIECLKANPESRRAVIQIFDAEDVADFPRRHKEVPCTCTLQFLVRRNRLHMLTTMRSNDAYRGLPHDIFCFTMLQEIVARTLGLELGTYKQFVGSLHLYDRDRDGAQQYLSEDVQPTIPMPAMPSGDPWPALRALLDAEYRIRNRVKVTPDVWSLDAYWTDLVKLLQIFAATGHARKIETIKAGIVCKTYAPYIENRKTKKPLTVRPPAQLLLPL